MTALINDVILRLLLCRAKSFSEKKHQPSSIVLEKTELLEQKYYAYQYRQFVTAAAICSDKTLWSLNILNLNEHAHAAQPTGEGKRVGIYIEPSYWLNVGWCSVLS